VTCEYAITCCERHLPPGPSLTTSEPQRKVAAIQRLPRSPPYLRLSGTEPMLQIGRRESTYERSYTPFLFGVPADRRPGTPMRRTLMAAKRLTARESNRSTKGATKQTHAARESRAAAPKSGQGFIPRRPASLPPLATATRSEAKTQGASLSADSLEEAIEQERDQLMQVYAMLKCLYEVLLYADADDSIMHADVANVGARLIEDCVDRLEHLLRRFKAGGS